MFDSTGKSGVWSAALYPVSAVDGWARVPVDVATADVAGSGVELSVAEVDPSGWLAVEVQELVADPAALSDAELIDATVALERLSAWAAATQARVLAEFADRRPPDSMQAAQSDQVSVFGRWAPDEVGMALRLSRGTAAARIGQSRQLVDQLPGTLGLWERGRLDLSRVRVITDATAHLTSQQARQVEERVLPRAVQQTRGQLLAAVLRAVAAVDPDGTDRHKRARRERRVGVSPERDGMASLWATLPAPDAVASFEWLSRLARSLGAEDGRGMDARRADLMVGLLTGRITFHADAGEADGEGAEAGRAGAGESGAGESGAGAPESGSAASGSAASGSAASGSAASGSAASTDGCVAGPRPGPAAPGKPLIQIVMPYSTLLGADDQPCELAGYGPIPAELARTIAADAVWTRLVTDPESGALLDYGRTTYRPPQALADFVRARDRECRNPICRRNTATCDLDHAVAWKDGGMTADSNLWAGCRHHHRMKDAPGWQVVLGADRSLTWTTPTGHQYTSTPHDYRWNGTPPTPVNNADHPPAPGPRGDLRGLLHSTVSVDPTDDADEPPF